MKRPDSRSLREALAREASAAGQSRMLHGLAHGVALPDLLDLSCLNGDVGGQRLLLVTEDQFLAGLALIAVDGLAEAVVLCPPDLAAEHLPVIAERAGATSILTDRPRSALPGLDALPLIDCAWPPVPAAREPEFERATEWLLLTSGTTGVPKLVRHDLAGLTAAIRPRPEGEAPPVWATFYDIRRYGGLQIFLRGILAGGSLILSGGSAEAVSDHLARLGRHGVTHVSGTPSHWRRVLMSPARGLIDPAYLRLSGEIADQAVLDGLRDAYPRASIGHAYASTEAGVGFEVTDGLEGFPKDFVGRPGEVAMRVVDGSLRIRSRRTASGYVGSDDLALADAEGFVDTGDMVEERVVDGAARYHFVGRRGGIINVGGLKVHPEEIEAVINRHARVRMSLVEGRRNPITGAIVQASVVLDEAADPAPPEEIRKEILAACRAELSPHKVPALLRIVPRLDVTAAGKLARRPA
ncbi:class I adenylate-forming enzyme family protein [Methylobacterium durans]|uniref:Long-chain-fatty-acid--CoA ligase n=1 Tax=Methylobacterium durans TaxID=2202825 RepID=A0A2U8W6H4_9HYPH|nr:fatty acid--CoA ligase family protein [Methylobacterium durans]AWN41110.1 long-chain fatty acid--CoA ligase [Methylobacterium durans]